MADLIEREDLLSKIEPDEYYHSNEIRDMLRDCPPVDAVPVVRCKDCRRLYFKDMSAYCPHKVGACRPDDFCSYGKRKMR